MKEVKRDGKRDIVLNEFLLTITCPQDGGKCDVEIANAERRDRRFMRAVAALVAAWFNEA